MPLNVALPSIVRGRLAGPWTAAIRGRHSSRFEVETETRKEEEEESVPDACMRVPGVDTLNLGSSSTCVAARYRPSACPDVGNWRARGWAGGCKTSANPTAAFCRAPFQPPFQVPETEPAG